MRKKSMLFCFALGLASILLMNTKASADLLCLKSTISKGKIKHKKKIVTSVKCPSGFTMLADTSIFKGANGENGELRIYGDGSAGAKTISADTTLGSTAGADSNLQYTDFTVDSGKTLTVPSGTVIRCTGSFTNNGTINVATGALGSVGSSFLAIPFGAASFFNSPAHPGVSKGAAGNGQEVASSASCYGGPGGEGYSEFEARQLIRPSELGGGGGGAAGMDGFIFNYSNDGSSGGGYFAVICKGGVTNNGSIKANGNTGAGGGGAGGIVILASQASVVLGASSIMEAKGGAGESANENEGPSGGGGGGIVHFLAPSVNAVPGYSASVSGGAAGTTSSGIVTVANRYGGGGGGACGGNGGYGGYVNSGATADTGSALAGSDGHILTSLVDPTALM